MLLADVLARFENPSFAAETVLQIGDLNLLARMRERAEADGQSLGEFAQTAIRRFAAEATDEEWLTLLGALARSDDPGTVCLKRAFAHALGARPACPTHADRHEGHDELNI